MGIREKSRACILVGLLIIPHALLHAQNPRERLLSEYIEALSGAGYKILYSSDLLHDDYTIVEEVGETASVDALREALHGYGLKLSEGSAGRLLVVPDSQALGSIDVLVMDSNSHHPIEGAQVYLDGVTVGSTDNAGRLAIDDAVIGRHSILISAEGYLDEAATRVQASLDEASSISIHLQSEVPALPEVVVTSSAYSIRYQKAVSTTTLDRDLVQALPDIGEEALRPLDRLPGVASGGISTRSHVRGGAPNEQLIIFDGLRLYEPYHLKDFQTVATIIDQNAISGIDFYSAGFPARYGDRMSGVVDIGLREPEEKLRTELGLSVFNTSILSLGTFAQADKGDWLVSLKRGNLDLISKALSRNFGSPKYADLVAHIGWQLSDRTYLVANALFSNDRISISQSDGTETASAKYKNRVVWLKSETAWSTALSSTSMLSITDISNNRRGMTDIADVAAGQVEDRRGFQVLALKQDWQLHNSENWSLNAGFETKFLSADYEYDSTLTISPPFDQLFSNENQRQRSIRLSPEGDQYAVYTEFRWKPTQKLIFDFGFRWDRQTYSVASNDDQSSPRLNALYMLGDNSEIRVGVGRYYQAQEINELQVNDGLAEFFAPQRADHIVTSFLHRFSDGLEIRVEAYQKKYESLIPRFENVFDPLVLIPELQIDRVRIDADSAKARGVEVTLTGENVKNGTRWWAGYTWSSIKDRVAGRDTLRSWDQKHSFKGGITMDLRRWKFSVAGSWHSGWPRTNLLVAVANMPVGGNSIALSTMPRNGLRHTDFHTLDIRASRKFKVKRGELMGFIEVSNAYNNENGCCTSYRTEIDDAGNTQISVDEDFWLPILPSVGVTWAF